MRIGLIDYGMGNLLSVANALDYLGAEVVEIPTPDLIAGVEKLILPGVGAFADCMRNLNRCGFVSALNQHVLINKKPILGICLGMQVMAQKGHEGGLHEGLGWIAGEVVSIRPPGASLRVPHIGWNNISFRKKNPLFEGISDGAELYFVHSFHIKCAINSCVTAITDYGGELTAAICHGNIYGTQFHPEKSQDIGLKILNNFLRC